MKRLLMLLIGLSLCLQIFSQERGMKTLEQPISEKRTALVIGNANYAQGKLKNPGNDARAIADALAKTGFEVLRKENVDRREMVDAIAEFGEKLQAGGAGLFYYAGHGIQVDGKNFLIPLNAKIEKKQDIEFEAVEVGRVLGEMDAARNRVNIVILDACRDNPFARGWRSTSADRGLAFMSAPSGTYIAYATAPGEVAADGEGKNGLYTSELLKQVQTPGLALEEVFKRTRVNVQQKSSHKQTPWDASSLTGDFYFNPSSAKAEKETPGKPHSEPTLISSPSVPVYDNMVYVEGGWFQMGSDDGFDDEKPVHRVYVDGFNIDKYEVTQAEYEKVMGSNPSSFKCLECPVENVSWDDAVAYAKKIGKRLPTEAEWEYAARGGKLSNGFTYSGGNTIDEVGWYSDNAESKTHPVGGKSPNELGIYDMSGNVWEWCSDWYDKDYYKNSPERNPQGPAEGTYRMLRGGSWDYLVYNCRVADRYYYYPTIRNHVIGFRLVRTN